METNTLQCILYYLPRVVWRRPSPGCQAISRRQHSAMNQSAVVMTRRKPLTDGIANCTDGAFPWPTEMLLPGLLTKSDPYWNMKRM
jgi:hypothetical protein